MDKLIQQVNLYQPIFRRQRPPFSAGVMASYIAIAAGMLLLVTLFSVFQLNELQDSTNALDEKRQQLQTQLDAVKAKLKPREPNHLLESQKDRLAADLRNARRLFRLLSHEMEDQGKPYSAFFRGLAESSVEGLWLKQLGISKGGQALSLSGHTLKPELVPRLLQALKKQPVFDGHSFGKVQMNRSAGAGNDEGVMFHLQTSDVEGGQADAG